MTHYNDIRTNHLKQFITNDHKVMWLLNDYNRQRTYTLILDCIDILNDNTQESAAIRSKLNHHDFSILNGHQQLDSNGALAPMQTLLWTIVPPDAGGLGEDINVSQLNKLNKAVTKIGFEELKFTRAGEFSDNMMFERMKTLRLIRKHLTDILNTNHFNNLFG